MSVPQSARPYVLYLHLACWMPLCSEEQLVALCHLPFQKLAFSHRILMWCFSWPAQS